VNRPASRRRLFWRIYRHGLLVLLLAVVATAVAGWLLGSRHPIRLHIRQLALQATVDLDPATQPDRLRQRVEDLHQLSRAGVAAYDADGRRLAAAGSPVPGPITAEERARARRRPVLHRGARVVQAVPLRGGGWLLLSWSGVEALLNFVATLLVILGVVALAVIPLTRAITRPLHRITSTAQQLGEGDLSARTGLQRRDELGNLARVLDEMAARLGRAVQGEKELWANISHEIRTPLARIRVAIELCAEEEGGLDAVRGHLGGISGDLAELDRLLDDVLMTARLDLGGDGGGLVLRREPLSLPEVAAEAVRRFAERCPSRTLQQQIQQELPGVEADRSLLLRVLGNLLDNAAKYSEPATELELALARLDDEAVSVEVRDRGIGVKPEDLPRLFDHFFRTDRSRSRGTGGSGLGLALCRRIVEAHAGTIVALQREGGGTVVRFTLPLHTS